jgi:hypothetical protein
MWATLRDRSGGGAGGSIAETWKNIPFGMELISDVFHARMAEDSPEAVETWRLGGRCFYRLIVRISFISSGL